MCKSEIFAKIIGFVSKETEIPEHEIIGTSRKEEVVDARCILIRLLIESGMYAEQIAYYLRRTPAGIRHLNSIFDSRCTHTRMIQINMLAIRKLLESN